MENTHNKSASSAICMLATRYSCTMTPEIMAVYRGVLGSYKAEEVVAACVGFMSDSVPPQWMPSPGEIAKRIEDARGKEHLRVLRQKAARDAAEGWDGYFAGIRYRDLLEWKELGRFSPEKLNCMYLRDCVRHSQRRDAIEQYTRDGKISQADRDELIKALDKSLANLRAAGKRIVEGPYNPYELAPVK